MQKDENNDIEETNQEGFDFEETEESGDERSLNEKLKDLRQKLKQKVEESKLNLDGWQRARAELVNKEKQIQQERVAIYKQASSGILEELIPVLDGYEMAKKNTSAWEKVEANWRMGVEYIFQQLKNVTENHGLSKIEPKIGENYDVNRMQSIEEVATDDEDKDHTISELIQSGYELNGKLLREAKVKLFIKK
jgi:molecular chaperone GrpE